MLDRGFYSADNINALFAGHHQFLISVRTNIKFVQSLIQEAKKTIKDFRHYDEAHDVYSYSVTSEWPYVEKNQCVNVVPEERYRIYVHIYYSGTRAEEEKQRFVKSLAATKEAVLSRKELSEAQKNLCKTYFSINETSKQDINIDYKEEAIARHMDNLGYFVLLSNDVKNSVSAIEIYRRKDMVEKAFDNLKERLAMRRTTVHSDEALQGQFFLQFLALIFISYIHKHMREHNLYRNYTLRSLLDTLDIIERYEYEGQAPYISEVTEGQRKLYECLGVSLQTTL